MIKQILSIGIICIVLVNNVSASRNHENVVMVYDEPIENTEKDYVEENLDDLEPDTRGKKKIVENANDDYYSNELPIFHDNEKNNNNNKHSTEFYRDVTKKPNDGNIPANDKPIVKTRVNEENQEETICRYLMCKKIGETIDNAHREIDKEVEKLVDAGKSIAEAKNNIYLSLSKAGFEFIREMMKNKS